MLHTLSIAQLDELIEQFLVPMFVIETKGSGSDFCITCMNAAFADLTGQSRQELLGHSILEIAATTAAESTFEQYRRCVETGQTIRFAFLFANDRQEMRWNKTLQYARSPEGFDRVIATAVRPPLAQPLLQDQVAFEDLRYFSSIADLQLENLSNAFSSAADQAHVTPIDEERIMRLHAVCRTVQSTVADIKKVVKAAQARHAAVCLPQVAANDRVVPRQKPRITLGATPALAHTTKETGFPETAKALRV